MSLRQKFEWSSTALIRQAIAAVGALVVVAAALVVVGPAQAQAAPESTWSLAPASETAPDGRVSLRHELDPGASVDDHLALTNHSVSEATFVVEAGDGVVGDGGAFDVVTQAPTDSGSWTQVGGLEDGAVTLAAGETRILPVHIEVPAEAIPGDHPAGVVASVSSDHDGVAVTSRVGVRLHLQVTGDVVAAIEVVGTSSSFTPSLIPFAPGTVKIAQTVRNTGNVRTGVVSSSPDAAANAADVAELLPGAEVTQTVVTQAWPTLWAQADITATPTRIGEDSVTPAQPITTAVGTMAISWTGMAIIVALALGIVWFVWRRRRRAVSRAHRSVPSEPAERVAELVP